MATVQHIGAGFPRGIRPGATRPWTAGEVRDLPGTTAADLLERHPQHFARVEPLGLDRAMPSPTSAAPDAPKSIASRHWKTLVFEVSNGTHDDILGTLRAAVSSPAVLTAIRERSQALSAKAQQTASEGA